MTREEEEALRAAAVAANAVDPEWYTADIFDRDPADNSYIAAASPDRILSLLAALDEARRERDALRVSTERANRANDKLAAERDALRAEVRWAADVLDDIGRPSNAARLRAIASEPQ